MRCSRLRLLSRIRNYSLQPNVSSNFRGPATILNNPCAVDTVRDCKFIRHSPEWYQPGRAFAGKCSRTEARADYLQDLSSGAVARGRARGRLSRHAGRSPRRLYPFFRPRSAFRNRSEAFRESAGPKHPITLVDNQIRTFLVAGDDLVLDRQYPLQEIIVGFPSPLQAGGKGFAIVQIDEHPHIHVF